MKKKDEKNINQNMNTYKSRNMKRYLLIFALMLGAVCLKAQAAGDPAAVLQKIVDLPDLQQYYPKNADGSLKQICIMQYPLAFDQAVIAAFDASKVVFRSREAITENKTEAYFIFRSIRFEANTAKATVTYFYNFNYETNQFKMVTMNVEMQKTGAGWNVTNLNFNLGGGR